VIAPVRIDLPTAEASYLMELVEQYRELVSAPADPLDPAASRLSPDAYPDEAAASVEFRELTRDDVSATRVADADRVLHALAPLIDTAPGVPAELTLDAASQTAWLRTLTGLRLVLAARIGIDDEKIMPVGDPRFDVYEWLGYRQELLLRAMDD
jgi:hypothetical protein